jgi:hypothetical protein
MAGSQLFFLELTVYPAIFALWKGRALPSEAHDESVST